jgi:hypothetical protein
MRLKTSLLNKRRQPSSWNIMEEYRSEIKESKKTKCELQKEWADEEAAARVGGQRCLPTWVVQIICEMLVNGTSPSAVPSAMQTMNEMLTGDVPKEFPSVSFVRSCTVVVEGIGETIAAMKLADASSWSQLWTWNNKAANTVHGIGCWFDGR